MILTIQPHPANKSRGVGLFGEGMRHEGRQRSPLVWTNGDLLSDADESSAHTPSTTHYTLHDELITLSAQYFLVDIIRRGLLSIERSTPDIKDEKIIVCCSFVSD